MKPESTTSFDVPKDALIQAFFLTLVIPMVQEEIEVEVT
jgi:hypothetical protein